VSAYVSFSVTSSSTGWPKNRVGELARRRERLKALAELVLEEVVDGASTSGRER
jgi:hypothetical protein